MEYKRASVHSPCSLIGVAVIDGLHGVAINASEQNVDDGRLQIQKSKLRICALPAAILQIIFHLLFREKNFLETHLSMQLFPVFVVHGRFVINDVRQRPHGRHDRVLAVNL